MRSALGIFLVIVALSAPHPSHAGTFRIDDVWYAPGTESATRINVRVGSSAVYDGEVDLGDNNWAIEANLIVAGSTYWASANSGSSITAGMRVTCDDARCGGFHEFDKCPVTTYGGYGVVAIYHNWSPETDRDNLPSRTTTCSNEEPEDPSDGPVLQTCAPDCGSPIVVDLDRGGFRFTDLAGGVRFDLDGDGHAERLAWVAPGSGDGWLVLDRDGDGAITSGAELFGELTPQPPSEEPHGFAALAVFDDPAEGGNGDGRITEADTVFTTLRVWLDVDRDGMSRPEELVALDAAGVEAIDLGHREARRRDRHGNELRYTSRVDLAAAAVTSCTDVFLLRGD